MMNVRDMRNVVACVGVSRFIAAGFNYVMLTALRKLFRTRFLERKIHNYRMVLDISDKGVSRELMLFGTREKEHIEILSRELKDGMVVFDLGANIGYYSIMMATMVGQKGKVYAVEPSKSNFNLLNLNVELNGFLSTIETYNMGISDQTGVQKFYQSVKSNWHTFYPTVHYGDKTESLSEDVAVEMKVMTIADFLKGKRNIDLIRMDVEGFEVEIFKGFVDVLADTTIKPMILFEAHRPRYDNDKHDMSEPLKQLFDAGYYVKVLASNQHDCGGLEPFTSKGYVPYKVIRTDSMQRGMYDNISREDAMDLICNCDYVRTVLLERAPTNDQAV